MSRRARRSFMIARATPGQDSGICPADPVDGSGQVMGSVIVAEEGNQGEKARP